MDHLCIGCSVKEVLVYGRKLSSPEHAEVDFHLQESGNVTNGMEKAQYCGLPEFAS